MSLASVTFFIVLLSTGFLHSLTLQDFLISHFNAPPPRESPIVLLQIDEESLAAINTPWPWERTIYSKALTRLILEKPAVIGVDLLFTEQSNQRSDMALQKTLSESPIPIILAMNFYSKNSVSGDTKLSFHTGAAGKELPIFTAPSGFVNLQSDEDNVVRRLKPSLSFDNVTYPSFAAKLYQTYNQTTALPLDFTGTVAYQAKNYFPRLSFFQMLQKDPLPEIFKGKIVLIGTVFPAARDLHPVSSYSPESKEKFLSGIEIFANQILSLLTQTYKLTTPLYFNIFLLCLLHLLLFLAFRYVSPVITLWGLFVLINFFYFIAIILALRYFHLILPNLLAFTLLPGFLSSFFYSLHKKRPGENQLEALPQSPSGPNRQIFAPDTLSEREKEIVQLLLSGLSNAQIGKKLFISLNTVKFHIKNIYEKLEVKSRLHLLKKFSHNSSTTERRAP